MSSSLTVSIRDLFRGFDIENTYLQDIERIEKLLCLVMIAFIWCYKVGDYIDRFVKPIQIKKHGHRAKSVFKYGLEVISNVLLNSNNERFRACLNFIDIISYRLFSSENKVAFAVIAGRYGKKANAVFADKEV